ncbi:MAG TPA: glucoamylase family protein [Terracidiphilus sp.]|nr:glucoamylase family protein [Terracidiphilus sp.]
MTNSFFIAEPGQDKTQDRLESSRSAAGIAATWPVAPRPSGKFAFLRRVSAARRNLELLEKFLTRPPAMYMSEDPRMASCRAALQELRANFRLLRSAVASIVERRGQIARLPRVIAAGRQDEPRAAAAASIYLRAVDGEFSAPTFQVFVGALQAEDPLTVDELWALADFLKFVLLESVLEQARSLRRAPESAAVQPFSVRLKSFRSIGNADWVFLMEPLIVFDALLNQDPAGAYQSMDFESRELYRRRVAFIARRSDCTETQVAQTALDLARHGGDLPSTHPRMERRLVHVGHYLVGKGFSELAFRVGFHPPVSWRLRQFVLARAEDFYITGTQLLSILFVAAVLFLVLPRIVTFTGLVVTIAALLVPVTQIAVELVNNAVTSFFDPDPLPKLEFSEGIPRDCTTLVAVPSLLIDEKQVRELVQDLEVRYLANRDPHLHFALLTDLPDSVTKPRERDAHPLVGLAIRLIGELNSKYSPGRGGGFMLLHRHRVFNTRQGVWMGWERKRGKLLDLNRLLQREGDAFPIKAGKLDVLGEVRYILTLDADTQLPRGMAAKLAGAIAHPLNQAIIDPKRRIVTEGYGILQPRMGVTVRSTARSRLAAIYSGQSGFDIYTRAVSDAYQDLFGEGIFAGKGIYEVETLHAVLNHRFPRNALLSHDLIEGAYARAGLVTDVELVDDYPSHYSAYTRRQHRWVRGDWQIALWMFGRVPDESGRWVPNPISDISRWKIFDNLRRSLVDPFLVILFVAGWLGLPGGPLYWTIVPLFLLAFPSIAQLGFGMGRALLSGQKGRAADVLTGFWRSCLIAFLHLVFLAHQTFLAFDAIFRSMIRWLITGERLLEWETAAQAERNSARRGGLDRYLGVTPLLSLGLGVLVWFAAAHRWAIICAAPVLLLWAIANPVIAWLNRPPRERVRLAAADRDFLLLAALRIWRYFHEFSTERHHYLVPDNVEEDGLSEAARISPTNIGLLLNARQAACALGFLTVPEFAEFTGRTLATIARLEKFNGHLYNWYDTEKLDPMKAGGGGGPFVSSVDSGNLVASLYTLCAGTKELARQPLVPAALFEGLWVHWRLAHKEGNLTTSARHLNQPAAGAPPAVWIAWLADARTIVAEAVREAAEPRKVWWAAATLHRIEAILALLRDYLPWMLPEYAPLRALRELRIDEDSVEFSVNRAIPFTEALDTSLARSEGALAEGPAIADLARQLRELLGRALANQRALAANLRAIAQDAERLAEAMDFAFLVHRERRILSIGYDAGTGKLHDACYDLVASEARVATFLAIARGDLPVQSWFRLGRDHTLAFGRFVLLSWTGTMFEYLMPSLWMRSYAGTLIARTQTACVQVQRRFAAALGVPWGISESGDARRDDAGHYHYLAYGVPQVALSAEAKAGPVISPYSTFLALEVDTAEALANLRRMASAGWIGAYGFYESGDYSGSLRKPALVREWMAHHQGMALLAVLNLLRRDAVQRWFHANPVVQATERLLHEVPVSNAVLRSRLYEVAPIRAS